ncbi:ATP-binding protein [Streptomyces sp. NPDC056734]|uniref:ATP-binding protein n=1 Tax=Streptomyces sp. NPDC056734 TaxID=3345931 RepID=UPI0036A941D8
MTSTVMRMAAGTDISFERDPASTPHHLTPADAAWPRRFRRIVRASLTHRRQPDLVEPAELLATELLTNALRHGTGPTVRFRMRFHDDHLLIEVADGSPTPPSPRHATPDDETGRGLFLVDAIADDWGVSGDGTTTWCSLALTPTPEPAEPRP